MKRSVLMLCVICICFIACGQENSILKKKIQLLQYPDDFCFPSDSSGYFNVKNLKFYTESGENDFFNIDSSNVHFVDFNNDGLKDIIYQNTEHYIATILFENKNDRFTEIGSIPGKLLAIEQGEKTVLYLLKNFIGCDEISMLIELSVLTDNTISYNSLLYYKDTTIESMHETLTEQKVSGILRTQPIVDDNERTDPCTGQVKKGNQVRTIDNEKVTVIFGKEDWLLVYLEEQGAGYVAWIED